MPVENSVLFKHDTKEHRRIIDAFKDRLRAGRRGLALRSEKWIQNENMMKAYLPTSDNDALRKTARKAGTPQYVTMEIPFSYSMMLTIHTYLSSIFLSRTPIVQVTGRHGESQQSEQCVEAILDYQIQTGGALPFMYVWLLDPLRYGHGILGHYWEKEIVTTTIKEEVPRTFLGIDLGKIDLVERLVEVRGYEGAKFFNVRPQDFLFDPRLPFMRFQEGEFVIRQDQIGWNRVVERELAGQYFNVDKAKETVSAAHERDRGSSQTELPEDTILDKHMFSGGDKKVPSQLNIHEFHLELIPREYEIGTSERPEKWVFTVASETTIIGAQPLGLLHNKFPFDGLEYEIGGYELYNRSALEITKPLNDTMSWLFNSHFYNVRKTLNDQFLVDPSMIDMRDLEDPNPGRLIKVKPAGYGRDISQFVQQFPSVDVTRSNMADTEFVEKLGQKLTGTSDNIMGQLGGGGRKTATEVRTSSSFGTNRLKTTAEWWSATGWSPMVQKLIQQTQQLYDEERKFRIVGDLAQFKGTNFLTVTPEQIAGFYDFTPIDGTLPIDRFAQANLWQQIMQGMTKLPQLLEVYDVAKIFAFTAQLAGLKNISQFKIEIVPDEQVDRNLQSGASVPIEGTDLGEPKQIPNLGATS